MKRIIKINSIQSFGIFFLLLFILSCNKEDNSKNNMVLVSNVIYSQNAQSIRFPNGSTNVFVEGNVVFRSVTGTSSGYITTANDTNPPGDFTNLSWNAALRNAIPVEGSLIIGAGSQNHIVKTDITGANRRGTLESGCYDNPDQY